MHFEWDKAKSRANAKKHGVTFEEASSVFYEESAILFGDPQHSGEEERFLLLGPSSRDRLLVVAHCCREGGEVLRIISAREATRREKEAFREQGGDQ